MHGAHRLRDGEDGNRLADDFEALGDAEPFRAVVVVPIVVPDDDAAGGDDIERNARIGDDVVKGMRAIDEDEVELFLKS